MSVISLLTKTTIINQHDRICPVCREKITNKSQKHHITRIPSIVLLVHKDCHIKIHDNENNQYNHLLPIYTRKELATLIKCHAQRRKIRQIRNILKDIGKTNREIMNIIETEIKDKDIDKLINRNINSNKNIHNTLSKCSELYILTHQPKR